MPDKSEVIMQQMDQTRKDLAEKLETLEKKVAGTVETVTERCEIPNPPGTGSQIRRTASTVRR